MLENGNNEHLNRLYNVSIYDMENEHKHEDHQKEMFELNVLDMQLRQMEQQALMLEQQIAELTTVNASLDELKKSKKNQKVLFPISRDIFAEGILENSNEVLVNIGSKTIARKSIEEAKKINEKQIEIFAEASENISREMQRIVMRIREIEQAASCQ